MLTRPALRCVRTLRPLASGIWASAPSRSLAPLAPSLHYAARHLSQETRTVIDAAVDAAPVVLFMKGTPEFPQCGFSRASIQILGQQGLDPSKFAAFNVLESDEIRAGIKEYSDWPTIPQLYVDKEFVGGCDIITTMFKNGELAKLFEDKGVLVPMEEEAPKEGSS